MVGTMVNKSGEGRGWIGCGNFVISGDEKCMSMSCFKSVKFSSLFDQYIDFIELESNNVSLLFVNAG